MGFFMPLDKEGMIRLRALAFRERRALKDQAVVLIEEALGLRPPSITQCIWQDPKPDDIKEQSQKETEYEEDDPILMAQEEEEEEEEANAS